MMFIILLKMIKYKLQIQQLINIQTQAATCYRIGSLGDKNSYGKIGNFIKSTKTNSPTIYIREQLVNLLSVIVL